MKAILTIGVSASGKSTWAKQQEGFVVIERDVIRRQLAKHLYKLEDDKPLGSVWHFRNAYLEGLVTKEQRNMIQNNQKNNIIISDTNLNNSFRDVLVRFLLQLGFEVEYKQFEISFQEAVQRDKARLDCVGEQVLLAQFKQLKSVVLVPPKELITPPPMYTPETIKHSMSLPSSLSF